MIRQELKFEASKKTIQFNYRVLSLKKHEGLKKAGTFTLPTGEKFPGEINIKGAATTLKLYSDSQFHHLQV